MLYHKDIWVPESLKSQVAPVFGLKYSNHALFEADRDRNKRVVNFPKHFLPRLANVIEFEDDDAGNLIKIVARQSYDDNFDLVLVIKPSNRIVKTLWLNSKSDAHSTLDHSKYASAPKPQFNPIPFGLLNRFALSLTTNG